jgi:hypothetical protein
MEAALDFGIACSLFDFDAMSYSPLKPVPSIEKGDRILYRGWMMNPEQYAGLVTNIERRGGVAITSKTAFVACHHLGGWYERCADLTPETVFLDNDEQLESRIRELDWGSYFVKDFVKSNTAELGSFAASAEGVRKIVDQIEFYRGEVEGGVCIRRVEKFRVDTERRYFVVRGVAYASDGEVPDEVDEIASRIDAPFFSVDMIEDAAGRVRLVELGDGQVSDRKEWRVADFIKVIAANA